MAPKSRKDLQAATVEDFSQDVLLVATIQDVQLKLGLLAAPEQLCPEPLADATAAPALHVELVHGNQPPVASASATPTADSSLPVTMEHKFRHRKGPDIIDRLINACFELHICNSQTKAVLATASLDLLPFGLGSNELQDSALPLQPAETADAFKVLQGSTLLLCLRLMHQPNPTPPASAVSHTSAASHGSTPSSSTSGGTAATAVAAAAAVTPPGPVLEPYFPMPAEEAASCNVLEFTPLPASPLPLQLMATARTANGALSFQIGLHLPSSIGNGPRTMQAVVCTGGCLGDEQLAWAGRCRAHLPPGAVQAVKTMLELDQPLLLEVARYLMGTAADMLTDPASNNYHALLQLGCAAEQLQDPGAVTATGFATAVGCAGWAVQQGKLAKACLPPSMQSPPNPRAKPIEDAPAAPLDGQPPWCPWQAAGTRFAVQLKLARPLYPPWQPPKRPDKQLGDVMPARAGPAAAQPPTAADRFSAKVKDIARELAKRYAEAEGSSNTATSSGANGGSSSSSSSSGARVLGADQQQALVFDLNRSGRYLAIKEELKQLLVEVVKERYKTTGNHKASVQVQQLHNDLYVHLMDELHEAIAQVASAPQQQQQQQQSQQGSQDGSSSSSSSSNMATVDQLLQLAAECEAAGDIQRAHGLHQRRLLLLECADAWFQYGTFCMREKAHTRAQAAFKEALAIDQQHSQAAAALTCLGLALATGTDVEDGPDATALDWAEVLGHSLKDAAASSGAGVLPWALLALLYRMQGKAKEAQARSCHQEVVRQSKAALGSSNNNGSSTISSNGSQEEPAAEVKPASLSGDAAIAANGYLAAAEAALQLRLPALGSHLLELATGLRDPAGQLTRRLKLAGIAAAQQRGDTQKALQLLRELHDQLTEGEDEDSKMKVQVLMGDVQFEAGNLASAKQHYRRALQKMAQLCLPRLYLRLATCFMATGDASIAADVYSSCLDSSSDGSGLTAAGGAGLLGQFGGTEVPARCATSWLGLGVANYRLGEYRSAELALAEANLCDSEHPGVWGYLALLSLAQGREGDAGKALVQAQRHGLADPELLVELADAYQQLGCFSSAAALLGKAMAQRDGVQVRCKLAAVLLAQNDYEGCHQQLVAGAQLQATEAEKQLLASVLQKLQIAWPHL